MAKPRDFWFNEYRSGDFSGRIETVGTVYFIESEAKRRRKPSPEQVATTVHVREVLDEDKVDDSFLRSILADHTKLELRIQGLEAEGQTARVQVRRLGDQVQIIKEHINDYS